MQTRNIFEHEPWLSGKCTINLYIRYMQGKYSFIIHACFAYCPILLYIGMQRKCLYLFSLTKFRKVSFLHKVDENRSNIFFWQKTQDASFLCKKFREKNTFVCNTANFFVIFERNFAKCDKEILVSTLVGCY
jgi:hypothetical protein